MTRSLVLLKACVLRFGKAFESVSSPVPVFLFVVAQHLIFFSLLSPPSRFLFMNLLAPQLALPFHTEFGATPHPFLLVSFLPGFRLVRPFTPFPLAGFDPA